MKLTDKRFWIFLKTKVILLLNEFFQEALLCILFYSCLLNIKAQNIWKLYCNTKEIQIKSYTSKGQLNYLVQNDDDGNKVDSVIWKDNIYVYSFANDRFHHNSSIRVVDFYSKFEIHEGTFLSPYVKEFPPLEEYVSDLQDIYDSVLPNGNEVSNYISISADKICTKIAFRNLNCRFNRLFSPTILQSYLSYDIIKDIYVYTKYGKLSKVSYISDRNILNIVFSYECDSIKILIEALSIDGRKDEYVYEWKRSRPITAFADTMYIPSEYMLVTNTEIDSNTVFYDRYLDNLN